MAKANQIYTVTKTRCGYLSGKTSTYTYSGTLEELIEKFSYTLEVGVSYAYERGSKKVNRTPKTMKQLMTSLENADYNAQAQKGVTSTSYTFDPVNS